jgi:hypothetical protein
MFNSTLFRTAISIGCLLMISVIASADTKIKSRQTSGRPNIRKHELHKRQRQRSETNNGQMITIQQCDQRPKHSDHAGGEGLHDPAVRRTRRNQPDDQSRCSHDSTECHNKKRRCGHFNHHYQRHGERKQMFGYTARHIITTMEMKSSPDACATVDMKMEIDGWYIDAAFALDCDSTRAYTYRPPHGGGGCRDRYESKQIGVAKKGFPVWERSTMFGPNGAEGFPT